MTMLEKTVNAQPKRGFCASGLNPAGRWFLPAILAFNMASNAHAEGFRNSPPGTFDLGRAGGRIAQVDDSSAVQQNPANMVDISGTDLQLTPSIVYINADFRSTNGSTATTIHPWKFLPNLFGTMPLLDGKASVGLGVTVPFGLSNEWDKKSDAFNNPASVLRYQSPYYASLTTINVNPAFSYKINDHLQAGIGLDVMWSELTLKQFYPWLIFPGSAGTDPDGHLKVRGSGFGFGGNAGVTWRITERQRFAVTYRSAMDVDHDGHFSIDNITPTAAFVGATARSDFSTRVRFPAIVAAGYGIEITPKFRLEADAEWIQFSRFKSLDLDVANNAFLFPSTKIPQKWHDTFTAGFGGDYKFAEHWVIRGGYQFYESPVPDSTYSPTIPDSDQNVITMGLGYHTGHHALEAAYGLDFYADRHIRNDQNPAMNGNYKINVHLFSVAYHFIF